jgi:hypothetical protein
MMLQPVEDCRKRREVSFIGARYGPLVIHEQRQAEGVRLVIVIDVPASSDPRLQGFERVPRDAVVIYRRAAMIANAHNWVSRIGSDQLPSTFPVSRTAVFEGTYRRTNHGAGKYVISSNLRNPFHCLGLRRFPRI